MANHLRNRTEREQESCLENQEENTASHSDTSRQTADTQPTYLHRAVRLQLTST